MNIYEADEVRYGLARPAEEAVLVFVKEDHRSDLQVKADDPARGDLPAIKLNWVAEVPTGIYTYRQMASVFLDRRTGRPFRETFSSHEWCGNAFHDLRAGPDGWTYRWTSYFETDAEGEVEVAGGAVPADALPAIVRAFAASGGDGPWGVDLLPTLWSNKGRPDAMRPAEATVARAGEETVEVPAGRIEAVRFDVEIEAGGPAGAEVYWVERAAPHRLVRFDRADGSVWRLRKSFRIEYWRMKNPGDERLRDGTGLEPRSEPAGS